MLSAVNSSTPTTTPPQTLPSSTSVITTSQRYASFQNISMQNGQFEERKAQLKAHEERYRIEIFQHLTFLQKAFNKVQEGLQVTLEERER
jgi:hypothetical protein